MKIYLSGPISRDGHADVYEIEENLQRFEQEALTQRGHGHIVYSPIENDVPQHSDWNTHMRADIKMLMQADAILLLPGWENSRGSTLELFIATQIGITILGTA